jgi:hypothetical protein
VTEGTEGTEKCFTRSVHELRSPRGMKMRKLRLRFGDVASELVSKSPNGVRRGSVRHPVLLLCEHAEQIL